MSKADELIEKRLQEGGEQSSISNWAQSLDNDIEDAWAAIYGQNMTRPENYLALSNPDEVLKILKDMKKLNDKLKRVKEARKPLWFRGSYY